MGAMGIGIGSPAYHVMIARPRSIATVHPGRPHHRSENAPGTEGGQPPALCLPRGGPGLDAPGLGARAPGTHPAYIV
jgi:hypothetical protein